MKEKLIKFYNQNKLAVLTATIIFIVGLIVITALFLIGNNKLKEYKNDTYEIKYDKSWKIKNKTDNSINLKHKSKSTINIEVVTLEEEYRYSDTEELINELLYSIGLENKEYKLLQKKHANITKNNYDGYKVLYENKEQQVMVVIAKKADKVMLLTYSSPTEYFDILLDSVQNIIYNFDIVDKKYQINNTVEIKTEDIKWQENESLKKLLKKNKKHEIANVNYSMELSIPGNFEITNFESTYGYYNFEGLKKGNINLTVSILERNIYEYLEKNSDAFSSLYSEFATQRKGKNENYSNFKEHLTKLEHHKYNAYLYKATYDYKGYAAKNKYENYILIYELDENHILRFKLVSSDNKIPKEFIDKIKFDKVTNYSSNIDIVEKDDKLIGTLKKFTDYTRTKYNEITLKLPKTYKEEDHMVNVYTYRYYGLNYDEENDINQYDVKYSLSNNTPDKVASNVTIYKNTGAYQPMTNYGTVTYNDKAFILYVGGYNNNGSGYKMDSDMHYVHKKLLCHQLETGGILVIEITGNGYEITEEVLNDLTNIDIMIKEYK